MHIKCKTLHIINNIPYLASFWRLGSGRIGPLWTILPKLNPRSLKMAEIDDAIMVPADLTIESHCGRMLIRLTGMEWMMVDKMVKLAMNVSEWNDPVAVEQHLKEVLTQAINNPDEPITVDYPADEQDAKKVINLMLFLACFAIGQ